MDISSMLFQEGWKPTNDIEVSQMLKYLSEKQKESGRVIKTARDEIVELEKIGKMAEDQYNSLEAKIGRLLMEYVLEEVDPEDRKETDTQLKYKVARGEIIIKKEKKDFNKLSDAETEVLSKKFPDFVKSEPKFQWGEFKKNLEITEEGKVIFKPTGEVTADVPTVDTEKSVSIKLSL